ncbi:MAG: bacillithiol system protein YtxJ [Crocinitomix sp.]|jgi:bacillithiol system protein YtxJ
MNKDWNSIQTDADIEQIIENSNKQTQLIFKDSVTCGISAYAKEKLQLGTDLIKSKGDLHYLDLLNRRSVSKFIAERLDVIHQSPQVIVLKDEKVIYTVSHHSIEPEKIAEFL